MFGLNPKTQGVFPFACAGCPYKLLRRCDGPESGASVLMQGPSIIGCLDNERQIIFYEDFRDYPQPQYSHQDSLDLPSFIPVVKDGLPRVIRPGRDVVFGVSLGTLLKKSGELRFTSSEALRRKLRLPQESRVALIGTSPDRRLERFWRLSNTRDVWTQIAGLNLEFATSCTFSVWDRHPRYTKYTTRIGTF